MKETAEEVALKLIKTLKTTVEIYKTSMDTLAKVIDIELEKLLDTRIPVLWVMIEAYNKSVPLIEKRFFVYEAEMLTAREEFDKKVIKEQLRLESEHHPDKYNFYISAITTEFDRSTGYAYLRQRVGVVKKVFT